MKKFVGILALILILFLMPNMVSAVSYSDTVRVGLFYGSNARSEFTLTSEDGFELGYYNGRVFLDFYYTDCDTVMVSTTESLPYHIKVLSVDNIADAVDLMYSYGDQAFIYTNGSNIEVWYGSFENENDALWEMDNQGIDGTVVSSVSNKVVISSNDKKLFIMDTTKNGAGVVPDNGIISVNGQKFRGGVDLKRISGGNITLVNVLKLDDYLYGVISREMSPSWPKEALKAQAVCARNYAVRHYNHHNSMGFDVCNTTCCQVYSGITAEGQGSYAPVDETSGELLFYKEELCNTVYSSSMGERTASVENVWGTPYPYLVSVSNEYEDTANVYNGKWTKTLTKARATEIMNSKNYNIGNVTDIKVTKYSDDGHVVELTVYGTNGNKVFYRDNCRAVFPECTYSTAFKITNGGYTDIPTVKVSDGNKSATKELDTISVITADGTIKTVSKDTVYTTNGYQQTAYSVTETGGSSDVFTFIGEGWGHSVGMSQYGAKGMAEAGFDYEDILTHYYTGTHLEYAF